MTSGPLQSVIDGGGASGISPYRPGGVFFLNEGQGLWEFLGSELGAVCYPPYTVTATRPAFRTRRQLLDYEAALAHADALTTAVMVGCAGVCVRVLLPDCEVVA